MRKAFCAMAFVLIVGLLVFSVRNQAVGQMFFIPEVTVSPRQPTIYDDVNISAAFEFASYPPYIQDFGSLIQVGNTFVANVTIYVPFPNEPVLTLLHGSGKRYTLGRLPLGACQFQLYVIHAHYTDGMYYLAETVSFNVTSVLNANIEISPPNLELEGRGSWITSYIELPDDRDVADINVSTIVMNSSVPAEPSPISIGDHDNDSVPDLMFRLNRTAVAGLLASDNITFDNVTFAIVGQTYDGIPFETSETVKVSSLVGDVDCDGRVGLPDLVLLASVYGSHPDDSNWNPNANFAEPWDTIGLTDLVTVAIHYGQHYHNPSFFLEQSAR